MKKERNKISGLYFLITVLFVYLLLFFVAPQGFYQSVKISGRIFSSVILILVAVVVLTAIINYFLNPKKITKQLSKNAGLKGWLIATTGGIISHGPPYVWYSLISELQKKGMSKGLSAVFLYTRAIKIPLLPMMIVFFGWNLTIILNLLIIISSLLIWKIMNRF
ncbi:MAG TPA: permease [Candidatus Cloacimonetes bacterium]|nr:permease [Candidatus Cloacimonadota bacterium]